MNRTPLRSRDVAGLAVATLLIAIAATILWDASQLSIGSTYGMGPTAMPAGIALGLVALALAQGVAAVRGIDAAREGVDVRALLMILGGLALLTAIIGVGGGYVMAVAALFTTTAAAFGRRALIFDLAIGVVLAVAAFLLFSRVLGLSLPSGPLERLIQGL